MLVHVSVCPFSFPQDSHRNWPYLCVSTGTTASRSRVQEHGSRAKVRRDGVMLCEFSRVVAVREIRRGSSPSFQSLPEDSPKPHISAHYLQRLLAQTTQEKPPVTGCTMFPDPSRLSSSSPSPSVEGSEHKGGLLITASRHPYSHFKDTCLELSRAHHHQHRADRRHHRRHQPR